MAGKICNAQPCASFVHHFYFLDKNLQPITDKSNRYKVSSFSDTSRYAYSPLLADIGPCKRLSLCIKPDVFNWTVFECGWHRRQMLIQVIDKVEKDTMNILFYKVTEQSTYNLPSFERAADSIPFTKGNFMIDGKMGQPGYSSWFSKSQPIISLKDIEWRELLSDLLEIRE